MSNCHPSIAFYEEPPSRRYSNSISLHPRQLDNFCPAFFDYSLHSRNRNVRVSLPNFHQRFSRATRPCCRRARDMIYRYPAIFSDARAGGREGGASLGMKMNKGTRNKRPCSRVLPVASPNTRKGYSLVCVARARGCTDKRQRAPYWTSPPLLAVYSSPLVTRLARIFQERETRRTANESTYRHPPRALPPPSALSRDAPNRIRCSTEGRFSRHS